MSGEAARPGASAPARKAGAWIGEMVMLFGGILAIDFALRPAFGLLDMAPHAFWLPVLVTALGHGTARGIVAAGVATALGWLHGWPPVSGEHDYYARMLIQWKEPILWLVAAFAAGAVHEHNARDRDDLVRRAGEAEEQRRTIADHAAGLREHIGRLEQAVASADAPGGPPEAQPARLTVEAPASHLELASLIDELETPDLETRVADVARQFLGAEVLGFWLMTGRGWERGWGTPELDRMLPSIEPRIGIGAEAISIPHSLADSSPRSRVRLAVPLRDPQTGWLGGMVLLGAPDARLRGRTALAVAGAFGHVIEEAVFGSGHAARQAANLSLLAMAVDDATPR